MRYYIAKLTNLVPLCVLAVRLHRKWPRDSRMKVNMVAAANSLKAKTKLEQQTLEIAKRDRTSAIHDLVEGLLVTCHDRP